MDAIKNGLMASANAANEVLNAYKKGLLHIETPLQDYVFNNIVAALDAQKIALLLCEYHSLVDLVEQMRNAQKMLENAPNKTRYEQEAIETLVIETLELEKKVDRLIEYIKNGIKK